MENRSLACNGQWNYESNLSGVRLNADDIFRRIQATNLSVILFSFVQDNEQVNVTMSFGFSVGDFIMAIELANKIRKEFVDAPTQFKAIFDEYDI
jgi:hypothetical protein